MKILKYLKQVLLIGAIPILFHKLFTTKNSPPTPKEPPPTKTNYDEIHIYIEDQMRRLKIPGISLAIVEGDQIVHQFGFGRARPGGEAPTPQTPFLIGSLVKSITALAVMQLVDSGRVELDATVQRYLPWFQVADPVASSQITVRHLLNQTSGFSTVPGMVNLADLDNSPDAGMRQARALSTLKLAHPAGTTFEYCNLNYNLLGLIIEAASGESYTGYIQRHIFEPLEMNHTYASLDAAKKDGLAIGHRYWFGLPVAIDNLPLALGSLPSGQLISCTEDLAYYLIAYLNNGFYKGKQILSPSRLEEMQQSAAEQLVMGKAVTAYGMGWFINNLDGIKIISHGGNVPEFSSYMGFIPEQKKAVVLLANSDQWGIPFILMEIGDNISALLAGRKPQPIKFGFIPWLMRSLPIIPILQITGMVTTLRRFFKWRRDTDLAPAPERMMRQHFFPSLIPNMSLAAILLNLRSTGLLRYMKLYMPDLSLIIWISGVFGGLWALVRTILFLRFVRKPS